MRNAPTHPTFPASTPYTAGGELGAWGLGLEACGRPKAAVTHPTEEEQS